jgi:RNA polymerase sigma-70 factor (ECF subfamily)
MGTLEGSDPDPFDSVVASEAKQMLARGLSKLKPIQRDVFTLRMMEGLSVQDTAKVLGIPEGTVKTHLHRARALLRKWFASHHWNV